MEAIRLIMSGAVVSEALAAEFGPLPLAFLPVGGKRLYELQIAKLKAGGPVHIVLPESFRPSEYDLAHWTRIGRNHSGSGRPPVWRGRQPRHREPGARREGGAHPVG